jgi:hypothetical protein
VIQPRRLVAPALLLLGLAQMAGSLLGVPALRALAAATGASPAPRVFSAVKGLETYSTAFFLDIVSAGGDRATVALTPERYARLRGPYNRRNVYGAMLAFGPVLATDPRTAPMFQAMLDRSLCGDRPLLRELGLNVDPGARIAVRLEPLRPQALGSMPRVFTAHCQP